MRADCFCNCTGYRSALFGEKIVSVPLSSPQIPHGLEGDLTRTPEVTERRLTLWDPEWPEVLDYHSQYWRQVLMKQNRSGRQWDEETVGTILNSKHTKCIWISVVNLFFGIPSWNKFRQRWIFPTTTGNLSFVKVLS